MKITNILFIFTFFVASIGAADDTQKPVSGQEAWEAVGTAAGYGAQKTWEGTQWLGGKAWEGTKWVGRKTTELGSAATEATARQLGYEKKGLTGEQPQKIQPITTVPQKVQQGQTVESYFDLQSSSFESKPVIEQQPAPVQHKVSQPMHSTPQPPQKLSHSQAASEGFFNWIVEKSGEGFKATLRGLGISARAGFSGLYQLGEFAFKTKDRTLISIVGTVYFYVLARMVLFCNRLKRELNGDSYWYYPLWTGPLLAGYNDFPGLSWRTDADAVDETVKNSLSFRTVGVEVKPKKRTWNYTVSQLHAMNPKDKEKFKEDAKKDLESLKNFRVALRGAKGAVLDNVWRLFLEYTVYLPINLPVIGRLVHSTVSLIDEKEKNLKHLMSL